MKYVLAVSGGVDSVVLLDMIAKKTLQGLPSHDLLIAHFDHGIRDESKKDAEFVEQLAGKYKMEFMLGQGDLGEDASEDEARQARYEFLRSAAGTVPAIIITAHHQDDLLETIVMNIVRGTGWRGLSPMWSSDILRPLIDKTKADLIEYAIKNKLEWVEDGTNFSSKYFRNRVRDITYCAKPKYKDELIKLYEKQKIIRKEIEDMLKDLAVVIDKKTIMDFPNEVAIEVLRKWTNKKLTYPQIERLLNNIKKSNGGIDIQPGGGLVVSIRKNKLTFRDLD